MPRKCSNCREEGHDKRRCTKERTEVQSHGFIWERELLKNVYLAAEDDLKGISYCSREDLPSKFNKLNNCDIYVKTTGNKNTVCMADCLRLFDAVSDEKTPIHTTVIQYKQISSKIKKVESIIEIDLTSSRELLFGSVTRSQIEELDKAVKSVPQKRKPTKEEKDHNKSIQKALQKLSGAIYFNIKCNSEQSRLQCSFNKFQKFITDNPTRIVAKSDTNEFRGGKISLEIESSRRVFNKS